MESLSEAQTTVPDARLLLNDFVLSLTLLMKPKELIWFLKDIEFKIAC